MSDSRWPALPSDHVSILTARVANVDARLTEAHLAKKAVALRAASGDKKAVATFVGIERDVRLLLSEKEVLSLALEAVADQKADDERRSQENRAAVDAERRKAVLNLREAEDRADILKTIDRFKRQGDVMQVAIWTAELSRLRERLEREV
jgi:hypothetical protein